MLNIELKARCGDLRGAARLARSLGAVRQWRRRQTDTYYAATTGRIKVRSVPGQPAELIAYHRQDEPGARPSRYLVCQVSEGTALRRTLGLVLETLVVVHKTRTLYLLDNIRIHLDTVRGLGTFIEFEAMLAHPRQAEAATAHLARLCASFGIQQQDIVGGSYADLLRAKAQR